MNEIVLETKWLLFSRWHIQINFLVNLLYFYSNLQQFVQKGPINNKATSAQIMTWRCTGDKPFPVAVTNDGLVYRGPIGLTYFYIYRHEAAFGDFPFSQLFFG